ncbi:MAG TPA: mechanosensitive ion channel domain-containing protein [Thermoanaerobaculia bacterium]|jgi:small-conductance mechanosensitive channel|nr:mechanosensitive ion channel domain-containing protein [Thermoanaerobaculia bacterium]
MTSDLFGVKLVGLTAENGRKLLLTLAIIAIAILLSRLLQGLAGLLFRRRQNVRTRFWSQQAVRITTVIVLVVGILSVWFDNPGRLTTFIGLMSAGLAVALQRVVTALAAYFVILRGKVFHVGDRIAMSGVRGDVIDLGFIRTTIMEMGQSPGEQGDDPSVWVESRQYTGRVVTVTNDKIFDQPVYNYSSDFPYIWEEMHVPIQYTADRHRAEQILLEAVKRHTVKVSEVAKEDLEEMRRRYFLDSANLDPKVYLRLTDNWIQLAVRFVSRTRGSRELKDKISREILAAFDEAGIQIASATYEIVGLPPLRIETGKTPPAVDLA